MKIYPLLLTLTLALPLSMVANAHSTPEHRFEHLVETLNLDDGRAKEVRQIMESFHEKNRAVHQKARQEMKKLKEMRMEQHRKHKKMYRHHDR